MGSRHSVLLVEPWLGGSHAQWARGYRAASRHEVTVVGLDADRWRWRLRGGPAPLAGMIRDHIRWHGVPDLLLVSSPLDVSRLLGLLRRELGSVPVAVYQHESQLLYPNPNGTTANDADGLHDWFSWLAADAVFFNSDWHRDSLLSALLAFVRRFPDLDHTDLLGTVEDKCETLPLGLQLSWASGRRRARGLDDPPIIVWPHRWEPDKNPAVFGRALDRLVEAGLDFGLVLAGAVPAVGDGGRGDILERHAGRVLAVGPFTVGEYRSWLRRSDIVVSCATHDFFGVGVAEAVAAGCVPVVPHSLHYPELLGPAGRDFLHRPGSFGTRLAEVVRRFDEWRRHATPLAAAMHRYDWSVLAPRYDDRLSRLITSAGRRS